MLFIIPDEPAAPGPSSGHIDIPEAQEFQDMIEKIFCNFRDLLKEDHKDALVVMVWALKRHMVKSWDQITATEVNVVICMIHEPSCVMLHQSLEEGRVTMVDPDEEMPTSLNRFCQSSHHRILP